MSEPEIKPIKGMVVLRLLEKEPEQKASAYPSAEPHSHEQRTLFAFVVAAGAETNVKKGQTVLCRDYVRDSPKVDDDTVICEHYAILATVSAS